MKLTKKNVIQLADEYAMSMINMIEFIDKIKELEEKPEKAVIPSYMADALDEYTNDQSYLRLSAFLGDYMLDNLDHSIDRFYEKKPELVVQALLEGYEREEEKEQQYYVRFPIVNLTKGVTEGYSYLVEDKPKKHEGSRVLVVKPYGQMARLTEREIREINENYWAFAVPVEED